MYVVIQRYTNSNSDPIELKAGDRVSLGEIFKDDEMWPNWINCVSGRTGKRGWTPLQILQIEGETGVATTDYTAVLPWDWKRFFDKEKWRQIWRSAWE